MRWDRLELNSDKMLDQQILIQSLNGYTSIVDNIGFKEDGIQEYCVNDVPSSLVVLSAQDYCQDDASILFPSQGEVLRLSEVEISEM